MKPPEISLERLSELELPRLDPAAVDLRALHEGPKAEWFSWIDAVQAAIPAGKPGARKRRSAAPAREGAIQLGPFEFLEEAGRVSVRLEGEERFVVDTKAFTGTTVSLTVQNGVVEIVLADALFPGTSIPADLKARIWLENGVWMLRLRLKLGGFDATLPLVSWLTRVQPAVSLVDLDATCLPLGPASALVAHGPALAAFTPDWLLAVGGLDVFEVVGVEEKVTADLALIALVPAGAAPIVLPATYRRTLILLGSFEQFPLRPELGPDGPEAVLDGFRFDSLAFDAGVDPTNAAWRVLIARSVNDPTTMGLVPGGDLRATDGRPFRIPVANPTYVVLYDEARNVRAAAVVAQGPPQPVWMHAPTCSLLVGRSREVPIIGVLYVPGQPPLVNCRLALNRLAFHLEGLLVDPAELRAEVFFTWGPPANPLPENAVHVEVDTANDVAILRLPSGATTSVVRRDDFLALGFEFRELVFEGRGPVGTFRPPAGQTPHLVVVAQAQSFGEEAFFEADPSYPANASDATKQKNSPDLPPNVLPPPPVKALLAKPSRLAFGLPQAIDHLDLTPDELLDWNRLAPSLAPTALPGEVMLARGNEPAVFLPPPVLRDAVRHSAHGVDVEGVAHTQALAATLKARSRRPLDRIDIPLHIPLKPAPPTPTETAIEAPFRLLVSPNAHGAWKHASAPVTHDGRTELWHTRLAVRAGDQILDEVHPFRTLRAIWSRDHDITVPPGTDPPFLMSLDKDDRFQLVHLTSDYGLQDVAGHAVPPRPVGVRRFMLSALGAWMDTEFGIEPPAGFSVEEWRHRATMGRDHYVRVVYKGFLFPFGHRASLVKITERKIEHGPDGVPTAYLRQRMYIIVRERERTYPPADDVGAYLHAGRETPFRRVRITTVVTPNLDPPKDTPLGGAPLTPAMIAFWPNVAKKDFKFHLKAWDWEDREADFLAPLAFVRADYPASGSAPNFTQALADFNAADVASRRTYGIGGRQVALAETDAGSRSKTSLETQDVTYTVLAPASGKPEPPCHPRLAQASVFLPPLRQMAGPGAVAAATKVTIDHYVDKGYDPTDNQAKLFAAVVGAPPSLDYGSSGTADKAGGVATPNLDIRGITRELGVVGDASPQFAKGNFTPASFFPSGAKLLGGISLSSLLAPVDPSGFLTKTPALVTENTETAVRTRLDWETTDLVDFSVFRHQRLGVPAKLVLHSELLAKKDGTPPVASVVGTLTEFTIDFGDVIEVGFATLSFTSVAGKKPDVHVVIGKKDGKDHIEFKGPLAFVKTIGDNLDLGGFTDPPFLDVGPSGVQVGYSLAIPTVAVGVFSLQNLALGARLMLPFTGEPIRLRFNLSERQNPFLICVAPFGGGGFFALAVGVDGVEQLEVSLEFGGNLAIDLGVASGGVYVMAGIYLKIKLATPEESLLTGYVRLGGSLQVLGIIAISIEFYLGLSYSKPKAWGEARVTVKVEILFISKSVTITARREFAGDEGDPPFGILMPQPRWAEYAAAFAA